ncbi:MAG: ABC transporter permease subunit [Anaerolineae bacterium]
MINTSQSRSPGFDWQAILAIATRDIRIVSRSKGVLLPMILVPLLLLVIMPAAFGLIAPHVDVSNELEDLETFLEMMPTPLSAEFEGYTPGQTMLAAMWLYFYAPLFLIIPTMTASVIAAGSFAGEKERKTLEALLYTPTTDAELVLGKMLAAWIPAILVNIAGFLLYGTVVNATAWGTMGGPFFPNTMWLVLVFWTGPAAAGLGLGSTVLVSSKVNTYQDAYQLSGLVVLPIIILILGQLGGVVYLSPVFVFAAGLLLWVVDAVILWFATRTFQRSEIVARL